MLSFLCSIALSQFVLQLPHDPQFSGTIINQSLHKQVSDICFFSVSFTFYLNTHTTMMLHCNLSTQCLFPSLHLQVVMTTGLCFFITSQCCILPHPQRERGGWGGTGQSIRSLCEQKGCGELVNERKRTTVQCQRMFMKKKE